MKNFKRRRAIHGIFLAILIIVWIWSGINPRHMDVWLLENILVLIAVPLGVFLVRYFHLSTLSYFLFTSFLILHLIGSHYTYAEVPFGYTLGEWLGLDRNMYDRLVHFAFGLLLAFPIREMFFRVARVTGIWAYIFPLDITLSLSALFEIVEWGVVKSSGSEAGVLFLATQWDMWDPVLDILAAAVGALVTLAIIGLVNWKYSKPFREEVKESFRVTDRTHRPSSEVNFKDVIEETKRRRKLRRERKRRRRASQMQKKAEARASQRS